MQLLLSLAAAFAFALGGAYMKQSEGARVLLPTLAFCALFCGGAILQALAMRTAEMSTTYIVVLGLEAAMAVAVGAVWFGERLPPGKLGAVAVIIAGVALLRSL